MFLYNCSFGCIKNHNFPIKFFNFQEWYLCTRYKFSGGPQCHIESYDVFSRMIYLSGDIEENPGSAMNSLSFLEARLSELNRRAFDVGGRGDCFFRAVSHQLYGNPNHQVRSLGVQYLVDNPEHFIESNIQQSWQGY